MKHQSKNDCKNRLFTLQPELLHIPQQECYMSVYLMTCFSFEYTVLGEVIHVLAFFA